ncbi:MAG: hypothetical protein V4795_16905 [Pseudomonadota bacterium]
MVHTQPQAAQRPPGSSAALRPFGSAADLDLDFGHADRPGLVTALLAQCVGTQDAEGWWQQPVSLRTAALLALVARTEGCSSLAMTARCMAPGCGVDFGFDLPLQGLPAAEAGQDVLTLCLDDRRTLTLRRPTGDDLRHWHAALPADDAAAPQAMLARLVLAGPWQDGDATAVAAAIAEADPLVDFSVACQCPDCGAANSVAIDLEGLALTRLLARQQALLQQVHQLALHYGWTEATVLAVPAARRAQYLALIEARP